MNSPLDKDNGGKDLRVGFLTPRLRKSARLSKVIGKKPHLGPSVVERAFIGLKNALRKSKDFILKYHLHYAAVVFVAFLVLLQSAILAVNYYRPNYPVMGLRLLDQNVTSTNGGQLRKMVNDAIMTAEHNPVQLKCLSVSAPVTARQLGARYSQEGVVSDIYLTGRSGNLWNQIVGQDSALLGLNSYRLGFPYVNDSLTKTFLMLLNDTCKTSPVNAAITTSSDQIGVASERAGKTIDVEKAVEAIKNLGTNFNKPSLALPLQDIPADITASDINQLMPQIQNIAGQSLTVTTGDQTENISKGELVSTISIEKLPDPKNISSRVTSLTFNIVAIDKIIARLETSLNHTNPQTQIVDGNSTVTAGQNGTMIDGPLSRLAFMTVLKKRSQQLLASSSALSPALNKVPFMTLPKAPQPNSFDGQFAAYINKKPAVIFAFDGVPNSTYTPDIVSMLNQYKVKGLFFIVGRNAKLYPDVVKDMSSEGHVIGISGYDYRDNTSLSSDTLISQIADTKKVVQQITNKTPDLFHPPFNIVTDAQVGALQNNHMQVIYNSVDSYDWGLLPTLAIVKQVVDNSKPGSIIMFHALSPRTKEALPLIITALRQKGFEIN